MANEMTTLRVSAKDLINTSETFRGNGNQVASLTGEMMNLAKGLSSIWQGEAANAYVNKFSGLEDDMQKMVAMINEHVDDLQTMAANYEGAESEAVQATEVLSSDVIV